MVCGCVLRVAVHARKEIKKHSAVSILRMYVVSRFKKTGARVPQGEGRATAHQGAPRNCPPIYFSFRGVAPVGVDVAGPPDSTRGTGQEGVESGRWCIRRAFRGHLQRCRACRTTRVGVLGSPPLYLSPGRPARSLVRTYLLMPTAFNHGAAFIGLDARDGLSTHGGLQRYRGRLGGRGAGTRSGRPISSGGEGAAVDSFCCCCWCVSSMQCVVGAACLPLVRPAPTPVRGGWMR